MGKIITRYCSLLKMSIFGEIVEPGSRNTWEDWDDYAQDETSRLKWQTDPVIPEKIKTLLILEGRYLADSVKTHTEFKFELINSIPEVNLKLYKTETSDCLICLLNDYNLLNSGEIIELLKRIILTSEDIIAVLTKPIVEYQVQELSSQSYVLRSLSTSKPVSMSLNVNFPKLEQPNIISGVSAGVLSLRENLNRPAVAVVCYIEHPEDYKIDELQELLQKLNVVSIKTPTNNLLSSNLYI